MCVSLMDELDRDQRGTRVKVVKVKKVGLNVSVSVLMVTRNKPEYIKSQSRSDLLFPKRGLVQNVLPEAD